MAKGALVAAISMEKKKLKKEAAAKAAAAVSAPTPAPTPKNSTARPPSGRLPDVIDVEAGV